jgi:isoquinoline 1-oxidoreductase subunit alpha
VTKFTVNNQPIQYRMPAETPLLWALRDASNLTGTKYGCDSGECGACTVDVDGRAVLACQVTIGVMEGSNVTTIEGLSRDRGHPVQQAFAEERVVQCGYCTPGMIMAIAVMLKNNPEPDDEAINAAITNLCPCGSLARVRKAIRLAGRIMTGKARVAAAPPPGIDPADAARAVPALTPVGDQ